MPLNDFRSVHLPYCLTLTLNKGYVVLNREYKPLGFITKDFIKYEEYPIEASFLGITPALASQLSWNNDENLEQIFLYNDKCIPTDSEEYMDSYLKKLKLLAKLKIHPSPSPS